MNAHLEYQVCLIKIKPWCVNCVIIYFCLRKFESCKRKIFSVVRLWRQGGMASSQLLALLYLRAYLHGTTLSHATKSCRVNRPYNKFLALDGLYNRIKLQLKVEDVHMTCLFWSYNYIFNPWKKSLICKNLYPLLCFNPYHTTSWSPPKKFKLF